MKAIPGGTKQQDLDRSATIVSAIETNVTDQLWRPAKAKPRTWNLGRARYAVKELDAMQVLQDLSARLCNLVL
jgi:hypothetical protein